jgi:hypothetical protein
MHGSLALKKMAYRLASIGAVIILLAMILSQSRSARQLRLKLKPKKMPNNSFKAVPNRCGVRYGLNSNVEGVEKRLTQNFSPILIKELHMQKC